MIGRMNDLLNKYRDLMNSAGAGLRQYKRQPNILTYGMNTRNKTRIVYEGEDWMRVLFVRPSIYDTVCDWYERMDTVQKHRKETAICKSPEDFWDIFDKDKFGVQYTTFYFDDMLTLTDTLECFKEIARLYGEEDAKYISENKMRLWLINSVNVCADRYCKGEAKYGKNTNATRRWTYICDMRIRCQE